MPANPPSAPAPPPPPGGGLAETTCRGCGTPLVDLFPVADRFRLAGCPRCQLVWTLPYLSPEALAGWYPPTYYGTANRRFNPIFERLVRLFRRRRVDQIERRVPVGRALDVGCGRGLSLAMLRERGWQVEGVELSATAAHHARDVLGLPVFVGDFLAAPLAPGAFDVVQLWHVLEHCPDPVAAIRRAHALLRPGGLLVLAVPNLGSLQARLAGRHWFHLDIPRHTVHFRADALFAWLEREGFAIDTVAHFSLEQNPYGWIQSLQNLAGLRANLLYELLKRDGARTVRSPWREHPVQSVAAGLLAVPLGLVAGALTLLETALRRGGTVEVYARRAGPAV